MIIGAHSIIYSKKAEADRKFLRDVVGLPNVDAGDGWLIFGLPPAEVAVHPSGKNDLHEFYLMCEDVSDFCASMKKRGVACEQPMDMGWGVLTRITLPGGGKLGVYQPRHARPKSMTAAKTAMRRARAVTKQPVRKVAKKATAKSPRTK